MQRRAGGAALYLVANYRQKQGGLARPPRQRSSHVVHSLRKAVRKVLAALGLPQQLGERLGCLEQTTDTPQLAQVKDLNAS